MKHIMILAFASLIALAVVIATTIGGAAQPVSAAAQPGLVVEAANLPESAVPQQPFSGELARGDGGVAFDHHCVTQTTTTTWPVAVYDSTGYLLGWWITTVTQTFEYCYPGPTVTLISSSRTVTWQPNPIPPGA